VQSFQPKLILTIDRRKGIELDLGLSEETRASLEKLVLERGIQNTEEMEDPTATDDVRSSTSDSASEEVEEEATHRDVKTFEIPLYADVEFFHNLTSELASLDEIQARAEKSIKTEIVTIGHEVTTVAVPTSFNPRSDLYPWREIFRLYLETGIFFSSLEIENHRERSVEDAQTRLEKFKGEISRLDLQKQFKNRRSAVLLARFMAMNEEVMRVLRFQAINKIAMRKILKSTCSPFSDRCIRIC
jgi:E3 ubiquitin-protein ligase BAH